MFKLASIFVSAAIIAAPALAEPVRQEKLSSRTAQTGASSTSTETGVSTGINWYQFGAVESSGVRFISPFAPPLIEDGVAFTFSGLGRWGLSFDLKSREQSDILPKEEFSARAYYQISPRFRFGGQVSVGGDALKDATFGDWQQKDVEAGVRLESAFSF